MSTVDEQRLHEEVHQGYDLETGLLQRLREWVDVLPWLRLTRALRAAAAVSLLGVTTMTLMVWTVGLAWIIGYFVNPSQAVNALRSGGQWFAAVAWTFVAWAPAAVALTRQGALLTAGRPLMALKPLARHSIGRSISAWVATVVPIGCVFVMGLSLTLMGLVARLVHGLAPVELAISCVAALIAIPCGVLAFGGLLAVPLSWAAIANEKDPDPLDALSRGYESLYRRPLQMAVYVIASGFILAVAWFLAGGVSWAAILVSRLMFAISGCSPTVPQMTSLILQQFPLLIAFTLAWSLVGGIYLLLRYDTGGQEVEDIWQAGDEGDSTMPELPKS